MDTYVGPSGRTVTLIGMVHIADAEFYTVCEQIVADREGAGAVVHYEAVTDRGEDRSKVETDLIYRLNSNDAIATVATLLGGLALQHRTNLPIQPHWVNPDISLLELLRLVPDAEEFVAVSERVGSSLEDMTPEMLRLLEWALRHLPALRGAIAAHSWISPRRRRVRRAEQQVILAHRNNLAAKAILAESRDVVALWGAGHLDGIGTHLTQSGYCRTHTRWLPAIRPGRLKDREPQACSPATPAEHPGR